MSFRDDEQAAHHRRDALEREVVALERRQHDAVATRRAVDWPSVIPVSIGTLITASFTVTAIVLGWSVAWAICGFVLTSVALLALIGSTGSALPLGAVPIRLDLDVPCVDGRAKLRLLATVRLATDGKPAETAAKMFKERPRGEVSDAAIALLEAAVREVAVTTRPSDLGGKPFIDLLDGPARAALARAGIELTTLWAGPA